MADQAIVKDQPRQSSPTSKKKQPRGNDEKSGHKKKKRALSSTPLSSQHDMPAGDFSSHGRDVNNVYGPSTDGD